MARPGRPASESYQPVCCSVAQSLSYSCEAGTAVVGGAEDEDDQAPIFSLSKSSMDVVTATHRRDPAWARMALRRSSSASAHPKQSAAAETGDPGRRPAPPTEEPPGAQRWSGCSGTHSRSSTPDTVVWRGGGSRPPSLTQDPARLAGPASPLPTPASPPADPLTSASSPPSSPDPLRPPAGVEDEGFTGNDSLYFLFPSPLPSSASLAEASTGAGRPADEATEEQRGPGGSPTPEGGGVGGGQGPGGGVAGPVCRLELPWAGRAWRAPLVSSLSDSRLGDGCRCGPSCGEGAKVEEGTMTSPPVLVDAEAQTASPAGSWWDLGRSQSRSILGSPPGSRLNLKSSAGSNSNLVSPSSSMFPVSGEEEGEEEEEEGEGEGEGDAGDPAWEQSESSQDLARRRSCLKAQGEERAELGRRSSMKQVQWDEDGMTWDIYGASVDPEELSSAIQRHLELHSPRPQRRPSKKRKAPKPPPPASGARAAEPGPAATAVTPRAKRGGEGVGEGEGEPGGRKEETVEAACRASRAGGEDAKGEGGDGAHPSSPSGASGHIRKRSVMRSLRRPGWCVGSGKTDD